MAVGGISVRVQSMVRNGGALSEVSCVFCGQWPDFNIGSGALAHLFLWRGEKSVLGIGNL